MVVLKQTKLLPAVSADPLKFDVYADGIVFLRREIRARGVDEVIRPLGLSQPEPSEEASYDGVQRYPHLDVQYGRGSKVEAEDTLTTRKGRNPAMKDNRYS